MEAETQTYGPNWGVQEKEQSLAGCWFMSPYAFVLRYKPGMKPKAGVQRSENMLQQSRKLRSAIGNVQNPVRTKEAGK